MLHSKPRIEDLTIEELRDKFKELADLLCLCAGCKSIRMADASWRTLEQFLWEVLGREVSHGLCPACEARAHLEIDEL